MPGVDDLDSLRAYTPAGGLHEGEMTLIVLPAVAKQALFHDLPEQEAEHWSQQLRPREF